MVRSLLFRDPRADKRQLGSNGLVPAVGHDVVLAARGDARFDALLQFGKHFGSVRVGAIQRGDKLSLSHDLAEAFGILASSFFNRVGHSHLSLSGFATTTGRRLGRTVKHSVAA